MKKKRKKDVVKKNNKYIKYIFYIILYISFNIYYKNI